MNPPLTVDESFGEHEDSRRIFDALCTALDDIGAVQMRVTRSQVAFHRRRAFAWAWMPGKYLRGRHAPLVLSVALQRRDLSPRWKEIVEPAPGRFTHHLELFGSPEIGAEVCNWLAEAWAEAAEFVTG